MGADLSVFISGITGSDCSSGSLSLKSEPSLGDLPESCVALVLASLDPPEICKLARLNRAFRGASWADFLWESKLPSNYQVLVRKVFGELPVDLGNREIYARLCRANSFDCETKKFWLHKSTGGVCLSIASKGLSITGIDDRRYWSHIPTEESGWMMETPVVRGIPLLDCVKVVLAPKKSFRWMMDTPTIPRILLLEFVKQIWWFEVDGEVEFPFPMGTYSLFFRLQLGRTSKWFGRKICNTEHVHGWDIKPVQFQLWTSDGQHAASKCFLNETGKWKYYHVGDFVVDKSNAATKINFSMTQIDCTHTKGGLCLDSVVIYPSQFRERLKRF